MESALVMENVQKMVEDASDTSSDYALDEPIVSLPLCIASMQCPRLQDCAGKPSERHSQ